MMTAIVAIMIELPDEYFFGWIYYYPRASEQGNVIGSVRIYTIIRECGSTLYVGLARAVPPTNTNYRLTFLLTRFQEALYEDLAV